MAIRGSVAAVLASAFTALAALGPAPATASVAGDRTPQCAAASLFCTTPVMYAAAPVALLAMAATATAANAPVISAPLDQSSFSQDWTVLVVSGAPGTERTGGSARGRTRQAPPLSQTAFLEYSPAGAQSGRCAANVDDLLELRRCNGSNWQLFVMTSVPPGGVRPPRGWRYFLSDVTSAAIGQHLALTGSRIPGRQLTFTPVRATDGQFWRDSVHCLVSPRPMRPGWLHPVC